VSRFTHLTCAYFQLIARFSKLTEGINLLRQKAALPAPADLRNCRSLRGAVVELVVLNFQHLLALTTRLGVEENVSVA
jgi:hypothetical protein